MKLVMTLLVKNEADIVDENIRFHLDAGVSHIVATDNGSCDGTREILSEYQRQGILTLIDEPGDDYSQWRWVTRMALMARERHNATWIINNDADEFWWHEKRNLREVLTNATADILDCKRINLVYPYEQDSSSNWSNRVVFRPVSPAPIKPPEDQICGLLDQPYFLNGLPTKALVRSRGLVSVSQGNHSADFNMPVTRKTSDISVFHVPIRSEKQFITKITQGGEAYCRNNELPTSVGWHWRRWYRMLRTSGVEQVFKDALPSVSAIRKGLQAGHITCDLTLLEELLKLRPKPSLRRFANISAQRPELANELTFAP